MKSTRQEVYSDIPEMLETLSTTTTMLETLCVLLDIGCQSRMDMTLHSTGIERLFNQQCEDLKFLGGALREQYTHIMKSKLEISDIDDVARLSGVSPILAARVITIATGIKLGPVTEQERMALASG